MRSTRTMESGFEDLAAPAALDDAFREAEVNGGSAADATAAPAAVATAADAPAAVATAAAAAASAGAPSDGLDYAAIVHYGAHGVGVPGKIVRVHELVDGGDVRQATALPLPIGSAHATAEPVYAAAEADAVLPADASSTAIVALTKPPKPPRAPPMRGARAQASTDIARGALRPLSESYSLHRKKPSFYGNRFNAARRAPPRARAHREPSWHPHRGHMPHQAHGLTHAQHGRPKPRPSARAP